jgi:hypothetical protein
VTLPDAGSTPAASTNLTNRREINPRFYGGFSLFRVPSLPVVTREFSDNSRTISRTAGKLERNGLAPRHRLGRDPAENPAIDPFSGKVDEHTRSLLARDSRMQG